MHALSDLMSVLVPSLGWALLDFVWQGMLVGWIAALLFTLLRNARPQARYLVGCAALVLCAALPLAGVLQRLAAPGGQAETLPLMLALADAPPGAGAAPRTASGMSAALPSAARECAPVARTARPASAPPGADGGRTVRPDGAASVDGGRAAQECGGAPAASAALPQPLADMLSAERLATWRAALAARLPLVIVLWGCGVALLGLRMALGLVWVRQRSAAAQRQVSAAWQGCADTFARRLGIARKVHVALDDSLATPVTAGWWKPVVLLPASLATQMPRELLEALLAHELAHVRRHDYLVNLMQSAIEVLLFYHPTVWWLSARVRVEREQIADDLAAGVLGEPRRLALALSELDRYQCDSIPSTHLAPAADGGHLMSRIKRLVRPAREPLSLKTILAAAAVPVIGLSAACTVLLAQAQAPATAARNAPAAAAAAPAAKEEGKHGTKIIQRDGSREQPYAIVRGSRRESTLNGSGGDWREIEAAKRKVPGDFIWFRDGGKSYVIQDQEVLAQARAAWSDVDKLGEEMDVYGKQMDEHGKVMEELGRQMEAAADRNHPARAEEQKFQRAVKELARQQKDLNRKIAAAERAAEESNGAQRAARESELRKLEDQLEKLEEQIDRESDKFEALHDNRMESEMDAIGRKMHEAGKPMDALGKQMDVLGKKMDASAKVADKQTRDIIRAAQAKGLAIPAPGAI